MWQHRLLLGVLGSLAIVGWSIQPSWSTVPNTQPADGLRTNPPTSFALIRAKIVTAPGQTIEDGTLVIRDGVIAAVGAQEPIPEDVEVVDLGGKTIYPGFLDAFSEVTVDASTLDAGAPYWNSQVRPQFDVASSYQADKAGDEKLRSQGICVRLVAPAGAVIKGTSALVTTADQPGSATILHRQVAQHLRLTVSRTRGKGRDEYPSSPMGAVALARQAFYDADWYGKAWTVYRSNRSLPRPEQNGALEVLRQWLDGDRLVIADALNELFFLRADRFAREFGLNLIVRGSGDEYRRLEAIRQTGRAAIVPLNFPKPPNVATSEAAAQVSLESLMHWDLAPENAARLDRAGVRIAFCTHGLSDKGTFLAAVRKAVERGLSPESALRALTITPAELFGVADRLGTLHAGKMANFVITDGDVFDKKSKLIETWVAGRRYEIVKAPVVDVVGLWRVDLADPDAKKDQFVIRLSGPADKLTGTIRPEKRTAKTEDETKLDRIGLRDSRLSCTFDAKLARREGTAQLSAVVDRPQADTINWIGQVVWPDGTRAELVATRLAEEAMETKEADKTDAKSRSEKAEPQGPIRASFEVNYPLGEFGRSGEPEQPASVLFRGATIWTCSEQGILENASLLIGHGKILAVGNEISHPPDAQTINLAGSHVTPGIIDCHSHMATDGGVNEGTQAITAEVRIGDFIDCDDIAVYQQLAGGVTCASVLHGSANPIGGQNQVIKLRWGALDEQMKLAAAPPGIKFALGENVKQSNWGEKHTTRYPQTRMGVEQIIRDAFEAARAYQHQWDQWQRNHQGLPPRRDLELDALSEAVQGRRWIHCHSYRQDEILALIRTLDEFGIQIGTFQHILEGYKVADAMARHGAMGSAFSDWWAYKFEVYDAIPYNGALMHLAGVNVSFNSDDRELARHLNQEAAKAVKYGGVEPVEALKFVTLNPAKQLRIDQHVGSLEVGKDADFVIWNGPPLSTFTRCEQTWIDGRKYFDRAEDLAMRAEVQRMRSTLIQKILASKETMRKPGEGDVEASDLWPREDIYCHRHGHFDH